jgi:hypothetical protein
VRNAPEVLYFDTSALMRYYRPELLSAEIQALRSFLESLKDRILDSDCRVGVTAEEGVRGDRHIPLKVDAALGACPGPLLPTSKSPPARTTKHQPLRSRVETPILGTTERLLPNEQLHDRWRTA